MKRVLKVLGTLKKSRLISRIVRRQQETSGSSDSVYEKIGGRPVIDKLVEDFYQIMSTDPAAKECFATHAGRDMDETAVKLKYFLSGWLGGPPLYMETYGHPRLRMRHNPFVIGAKEAEQWLYCMKLALERSGIKIEHQAEMMTAFKHVAEMLINNQA